MKKSLLTLTLAVMAVAAWADGYDLDKPFGFCTATSRTDAGTYEVTGGGCYTYPIPESFSGSVKVLTSNGQDMKSTIENAIKQNSVVILDGTDGDFIVSSNIGITGSNKTLLGINGARICTRWYLTDEIRAALDAAGVPGMSTSSGTGGKLPNGTSVSEEAEYNTRKIIIEMTGDNSENYRKSGCISLSNCQNVIIRNITFVGPGSVDVGGNDLISCTGAKHCWVDHCEFMDGMDGNFDITQSADFNTVSWCIFRYTDHSYMHQNTNLIGASDSESKGYLNTTFAFNWWSTGCNQRMPMGRVGKIHMLNNYYSCSGASLCMNPRKNSEFLCEGNNFASSVKNCYRNNDATAVTWADNNYIGNSSASKPSSFGATVTVPYEYSVAPSNVVPDEVQNNAGPTLKFGDSGSGGEEQSGTKGSIYWPMSSNTNAEVSTAISSNVTTTSVTNGSNLVINDYGTYNNIRFTKYQAQTIQTAAADDNAVIFSLTTQSGYSFKASSFELYACKVGTNNGTMDITWKDAGGENKIWEGVSPNRNNQENGYYSYWKSDIDLTSKATTGTCSLIINIYNVGATNTDGSINKKELGLAEVIIKGAITEGSTGISTPVVIRQDGNIYNLRGEQVTDDYKGIIIINGKKYCKK